MAGQKTGTGLTHKANAKSEDDALERHFARFLDAIDNFLSRFCTRAVAVDLLYIDVIEVGNIVDESSTEILVDGLRP